MSPAESGSIQKEPACVPVETVPAVPFSMRYFRFGHGARPLVILPGLSVQSVMGSAEAVAEAYAGMAETFTVTLFDRRDDLPSDYTVADMARDTAEAMRALGLSDVCLFGASQGGMIAMLIAAEHPDLVSKLALGSTSAKVDEARAGALSEWLRLAEAGDARGLYLAFGEAVYPNAVFSAYREAFCAMAETVTAEELARFVRLARAAVGFDATDRLAFIRCPVLVLAASDDRVLGPDASDGIAEILGNRPDFSRHVYDGYGHAAYDTAPDYKERLYRFFTSSDSSR